MRWTCLTITFTPNPNSEEVRRLDFRSSPRVNGVSPNLEVGKLVSSSILGNLSARPASFISTLRNDTTLEHTTRHSKRFSQHEPAHTVGGGSVFASGSTRQYTSATAASRPQGRQDDRSLYMATRRFLHRGEGSTSSQTEHSGQALERHA